MVPAAAEAAAVEAAVEATSEESGGRSGTARGPWRRRGSSGSRSRRLSESKCRRKTTTTRPKAEAAGKQGQAPREEGVVEEEGVHLGNVTCHRLAETVAAVAETVAAVAVAAAAGW